MSEKREYKGRDVDEAVSRACEELGVERGRLEIEVVTPGSTGFLGFGRKQAVVLVAVKEPPQAASTAEEEASAPALPPSRLRAAKEEILRKADAALATPPPQETLDAIGADLEHILDLMGYPGAVEMSCTNGRVLARIDGRHVEEIIGREGAVIDALEYLLRKIVSRKYPEKIYLSLDAGDYRAERRRELESLARDLADQVIATGRSRVTAALNPAERRIVHVVLQNDRRVRSTSV